MSLAEALAALKRPIALLQRETQLQLEHESQQLVRALHDERSSAISAHTGSIPALTSDRAKGERSDSVTAAYESMLMEMTAAKSELVHLSQKMLLQLESTRDHTSAMSLGVGALEERVTCQTRSLEELEERRQEEVSRAVSRCQQLEAIIAEQSTQHRSYEQNLSRLRTQLADVQALHAQDVQKAASAEQQIEAERQQHVTAHRRLKELEAAAVKCQSETTQAQHRMRELEAESETYRTEAAAASAANFALRAAQEATLCELEEHRKQAANVRREHINMQERHRGELASMKKEHVEQLSTRSTELARLRQEHSEQLGSYQAERMAMEMEHGEQLQRQKWTTDKIEAQLVLAQSALDQETERTVAIKVQLARAEAARDSAEAELKMQELRAEAARETARAEHDSCLELHRKLHASSQEVQEVRRQVNDLQDWSSDLAVENELLRAQLMELQRQSQSTAPPHADSTASKVRTAGGGGQWRAECRDAIDQHRHARQQRLGESSDPLSQASQYQPKFNHLV